ncbi:MAG: hypothetical protein KJ957_06810 [Candidatus Omnitrophica bacterium]|nr:hypothetical protein [Candidatus Omnitrophota bacterium]MBU1853734.1 hypothetical protein [Candidatus Omnitrophota bacterium]
MFFIWLILAGLLQLTFVMDLNLFVLLAVFPGLRKGPFAGLLMGAVTGIFVGFISASHFAVNIALYSLVGFLSGAVRAHIYYKENIFMEFVFSFCGVIIFYSAYFILTNTVKSSIFSTALFSAALSPLIFKIVKI